MIEFTEEELKLLKRVLDNARDECQRFAIGQSDVARAHRQCGIDISAIRKKIDNTQMEFLKNKVKIRSGISLPK